MQTRLEFQEALAPLIEDIRSLGCAMNDPILYETTSPPADGAGQLLLRAKEYLGFSEYEEMLEQLAISPLDEAFLIKRLQRHTRINVVATLVQRFHEDIEAIATSYADAIKGGEPAKKGRLLLESFKKLIMRAERLNKELLIIFPHPLSHEQMLLKVGIKLSEAAANTTEENQGMERE